MFNHYKKPGWTGTNMNEKAFGYMPYAVIIHLLIAIYMYGCPEIFPDEEESNEETVGVTGREISFTGRVYIYIYIYMGLVSVKHWLAIHGINYPNNNFSNCASILQMYTIMSVHSLSRRCG